MDTTDYWSFAWEYSIWNAAITALWFWTNDLNPQTLSITIERVYTAFLYSDSAQYLQYIKEEPLFDHFVTTMNDAFKWELSSEDIGHKSGSKSLRRPDTIRF